MIETSTLTRRRLLATAGIGAVGLALGQGHARAATIPSSEQQHRTVVIGSGLGGAITAYRLARAGMQTVVLARGRRWPITPAGDTFPPFLRPDRRSSYLTPTPVFPMQPPTVYRPYTGLFEKVVGDGMSVLCGAGVGGSTLVYAGAWIRPDEAVFSRLLPAWTTPSWTGCTTPGQPGSWVSRRSRTTCYLAAAERTGQVTVAALHRVTGLSTDSAGRYRVSAERIDENGTVLEHVTLVADAVFCAVGSAGTSRLLVRRGTPARCPDSTNTSGGTGAITATVSTCAPWCRSPPAARRAVRWRSPSGTRATRRTQ